MSGITTEQKQHLCFTVSDRYVDHAQTELHEVAVRHQTADFVHRATVYQPEDSLLHAC